MIQKLTVNGWRLTEEHSDGYLAQLQATLKSKADGGSYRVVNPERNEILVITQKGTIGFVMDQPQELSALQACLLYTSPSPRDKRQSRMPSSA